jgi:hypothetical protein
MWRMTWQALSVWPYKMVTFGGRRGNALTNEVHLFNTDSMKWIIPAVKGTCSHRECHSSCALREKVYVMGGISEVRV